MKILSNKEYDRLKEIEEAYQIKKQHLKFLENRNKELNKIIEDLEYKKAKEIINSYNIAILSKGNATKIYKKGLEIKDGKTIEFRHFANIGELPELTIEF